MVCCVWPSGNGSEPLVPAVSMLKWPRAVWWTRRTVSQRELIHLSFQGSFCGGNKQKPLNLAWIKEELLFGLSILGQLRPRNARNQALKQLEGVPRDLRELTGSLEYSDGSVGRVMVRYIDFGSHFMGCGNVKNDQMMHFKYAQFIMCVNYTSKQLFKVKQSRHSNQHQHVNENTNRSRSRSI